MALGTSEAKLEVLLTLDDKASAGLQKVVARQVKGST